MVNFLFIILLLLPGQYLYFRDDNGQYRYVVFLEQTYGTCYISANVPVQVMGDELKFEEGIVFFQIIPYMWTMESPVLPRLECTPDGLYVMTDRKSIDIDLIYLPAIFKE